ncbi:MAG: HNH endonuclease [Thermoplasmata archaeon]|nr:HNH endonuclease [Thermoplasmata archaeon]
MAHKWYKLSQKAFERDNYTCRNCGQKSKTRTERHFSRVYSYISPPLVAHHIVRDDDYCNTPLSNLKTLCQPCHNKYKRDDSLFYRNQRKWKAPQWIDITKPAERPPEEWECLKCGSMFDLSLRTTCPKCRAFFR